MFKINQGKGFQVTFDNGYMVSVQFGPGNYCDNRNMDIFHDSEKAGKKGSSTAECAMFSPENEMLVYGDWGDTVGGCMKPADVLELLNWAAKQ